MKATTRINETEYSSSLQTGKINPTVTTTVTTTIQNTFNHFRGPTLGYDFWFNEETRDFPPSQKKIISSQEVMTTERSFFDENQSMIVGFKGLTGQVYIHFYFIFVINFIKVLYQQNFNL